MSKLNNGKARARFAGRTALVTGASAGIGEAFARALAAEGANVLLTARREARLRALCEELRERHRVAAEVFVADLADPATPNALISHVERLGFQVDVLVNNAGFAANQGFLRSSWPELNRELQVMVTSLTELMHRLAPGMVGRRYGRILNVASVAAFIPTAPSMLYTGIKSYVLAASEAIDMELKPHGVHVTALCPGLTRSEFHDVMGTRGIMDKVPGFLWQDADTVAREGLDAVHDGRPVCVPGVLNQALAFGSRLLPERLRYVTGRVVKVVQ